MLMPHRLVRLDVNSPVVLMLVRERHGEAARRPTARSVTLRFEHRTGDLLALRRTRAVSRLIYGFPLRRHSRVLLAGIQLPDLRRVPISGLDDRVQNGDYDVSCFVMWRSVTT